MIACGCHRGSHRFSSAYPKSPGYKTSSRHLSGNYQDVTEPDILSLTSTLSTTSAMEGPSDFRNTLAHNYQWALNAERQNSWMSSDQDSLTSVQTAFSVSDDHSANELSSCARSARSSSSLSRSTSLHRHCSHRIQAAQKYYCHPSFVLNLLPWVASVIWIISIWVTESINPAR